MTHSLHRTVAALLPFFLCTLSLLTAQQPTAGTGEFRLGVSGGVTFSSMSGKMIRQIADNGCPVYVGNDNIGDFGHSAGIVAEYAFSPHFGIASHLLYSTHPGSWNHLWPNAKVFFPSSDPNEPALVVDQVVQAEGSIRYDLLGIDLMGKAILLPINGGGAGLTAGVAYSHVQRLDESFQQRMIESTEGRLLNSFGYESRENGHVLVLWENAPYMNASSTRFSLRGGAFYDLSLFGWLHITPGAYYDYGLTEVVEGNLDGDWRMYAVFFQLDVTARL